MPKLCLILGNGFTVDMLGHFRQTDNIDVLNLFRLGSEVPWPVDKKPGFLSYKHCPNLWNLGVTPNISQKDASLIIENIISVQNALLSNREASNLIANRRNSSPIYVGAYNELTAYLKHLFIYYDNKLSKVIAQGSPWRWIEHIKRVIGQYDEITIITYNYDIWLERLLKAANIDFKIALMENLSNKITILKPHGSIGFVHKDKLPLDSFNIEKNYLSGDAEIGDFRMEYDDLQNYYAVTALIPPSGESKRTGNQWAKSIRDDGGKNLSKFGAEDEIIICGLSYWHVDRAELDELLLTCDPSVRVSMINPNPSPTLNAVLSSIFDNYFLYTSANVLEHL